MEIHVKNHYGINKKTVLDGFGQLWTILDTLHRFVLFGRVGPYRTLLDPLGAFGSENTYCLF